MAKEISDVIASGWFSPGPKVKAFEEGIARIHQAKHGIMVNSGTDALRLSLLAMKKINQWNDGDEVIVPALTFVATVNIVKQCGLVPVLSDVNSKTWVFEGSDWTEKITPKTRAVIPVHLFGLPADMPRIVYTAQSYGIKVLEDSCESMSSGFIGQWGAETGASKTYESVGSFGDAAAFSTYACHLIVTGVGGVATTNNDELATMIRSLANHGRDPYFLGGQSGDGKDQKELISRRFLYKHEGYSCRVSEFEAAVGIPQLDTIKKNISRREAIANLYKMELWDLAFDGTVSLQGKPCNRTHANMMFPILLAEGYDRDAVCLDLESAGIETRPALPLVTQPVYEGLWNPKDYPVAYAMATRGFYVGCHPGMSDQDAGYVSDTLRKSVSRRVSVAA